MFNKIIILFIFLISISTVQAFECNPFESKTVQHSVDDIFCVYHDSKLTPMQMEGQYNLIVELDKLATKQAGENIYNHRIIFSTKGVLLLKAPDNKIMTVEVIDPAEKEALTEMVFALGAQKLSLDEKDIQIAELTLEKGELDKNYLVTKAELEKMERIIAENQTVHDQLNVNKQDLYTIVMELQQDINKWKGLFYMIFGVLFASIVFWISSWMKANSQTGRVR